MNKNNKALGKNIAYMMFYQVFVSITPLIVTPYISRVLGATEIGRYTYSYSIAYYFVMMANSGILVYGSRRIAEVKDDDVKLNQTFSTLFWLHVLIASIVLGCYILAVFLGLNKENSSLAYIMIFYVLSSAFDVKWLFYGLENFKVTVLRNVVIKVLYVVLIFCFVNTQEDVNIYAFISTFVSFFLAELSLFILTFRSVKILKPNFFEMMGEFVPLFLLFIPGAANLLLRHFDKVMLGMMSSYDQLGFYENTDRILVILSLLTTSVGDVMLPRVSSLIATDNNKSANKLFNVTLHISTIVSCALAFGLISIAEEFVPVFFGDGFINCIALLKWIAPSLIMLNLSVSIRKQYLIPRHMERVYITATVSSMFINIIANALLIPNHGALGAVYGTLIAELSVIVIQFVMIHKQLRYKNYFGDICQYSIIGIIMYFSVRLVSSIPIQGISKLIVEMIIGGIVYILLVIIYMKLTKDELLQYLQKLIIKHDS